MTTLLVLTGPQGSGNHLFSKIFALHFSVNGWTKLNETYWLGHDEEPFANMWRDPETVKDYNWNSYKHHVTSISYPYRDNGEDAYPNYEEFFKAVQDCGVTIKLAVIGRDENVLKYQERRLRSQETYHKFMEQIPTLMKYDPVFVSQELLYLYKDAYLRQLAKQLDFPIDCYNPAVNDILKEDANTKYFQPIEVSWLDEAIIKASSKHK